MQYETLTFEPRGEIGLLTLNRPERLNAINNAMLQELNQLWRAVSLDKECRVVVMIGAGDRGFCSGLDLKEVADLEGGFASEGISGDTMTRRQKEFSGIIDLMRTCPQPVIAAVNGAAMGGGLSFAMAADVRLASPAARFCASYINIGLGGADMGSSYFLWRLVGWGRAAEMLMTGRIVEVDEAYRIGLVNHVYEQGELLDKAMEMAAMMVGKSPLGLRMTKEVLNQNIDAPGLESAIQLENRTQVVCFSTEDAEEGPRAFLEKRAPVYRDR